MIKEIKYIIALLFGSLALSASAQSLTPTVRATIEPDSISIGDRFTLTIEVEKDLVQSIFFPAFAMGQPEDEKPQFGTIECLEDHPTDTLEQKGRRLHLRKRYTLTAFDEGIYNLGRPSVLYADKNIIDTLYCVKDSMHLVVNSVAIDTTMIVRPIKPVKSLPFRFGEISGYVAISLGVLLLIAIGIYLLARYLAKRGKKITDLFKPEPPLPAHIVAIAALEELQNQKLWQNNKHKEYYSTLSDILRTYIDGRFGIGAMEMTSDEIIEAVKELDIPTKSAMDLVYVLRNADLVKFAKASFEAAENESAYSKVYYFVEETKPVEVVDDEQSNEEDK